MAAGLWPSGSYAAGCCSAECRFLLFRHRCLRKSPAMAAGLGSLAVMQQTALLPDVVRVQQSSVLVKEASWQQALSLLAEMQQTAVLPESLPTRPSSVLARRYGSGCRHWASRR